MATFNGSSGNDQYFGTARADRIFGYEGQDQLRGAGGNDRIVGGDGPDSLYGDQGHDSLYGDAGDDVIRGGRGDDTLRGGDGVDMLAGDRDDDLLFGDAGDDILLGGPGDDEVIGGAGADYINGGDGFDTVDYSNSPRGRGFLYDGVEIDLSSSSQIAIGEGGYAERDILVDIERVIGSSYDDRIDVDDGFFSFDDPVRHEAYGGPGDDTLYGRSVDHLSGGPGDDILVSSHGGTLNGGPGADTFKFVGRAGDTTIQDFDWSEDDQIDLSWFGLYDDPVTTSDVQAMLDGSTGNVLDLNLLGADGEGFITLGGGVQVSDLSVSDFIV